MCWNYDNINRPVEWLTAHSLAKPPLNGIVLGFIHNNLHSDYFIL